MTEPFDHDASAPTCEDVRKSLRAYDRGELAQRAQAVVAMHLAGCEPCRQLHTAEATLDAALQERLPRFAAPLRLRHQLAQAWAPAPPTEDAPAPVAPGPAAHRGGPRHAPPERRSVWIGLAVAAAFVISWMAFHRGREPSLGASALVAEAVNDHLRVVQSSHPVEIESGGIHQRKPWFTGKLDFAPRVTFSGDDEFPLVGGSVGYFIDRKAAVMVFRHKLGNFSAAETWVTVTAMAVSKALWYVRFLRRIFFNCSSTA